jgi:insertion element IS1 protein InsB
MNSSGIRDTARVLRISPTTVIKMIKKSPHLKAINEKVLAQIQPSHTIVMLCQWEKTEAEMDEMWSFIRCKKQERWLWHAIDHHTEVVLAYVLSDHKDSAFVALKALLESFDESILYGWLGCLPTPSRACSLQCW